MTEHQETMLDELLDADEGLTDWEIGFIETLDERRGEELSVKQTQKLESIWSRVIDRYHGD